MCLCVCVVSVYRCVFCVVCVSVFLIVLCLCCLNSAKSMTNKIAKVESQSALGVCPLASCDQVATPISGYQSFGDPLGEKSGPGGVFRNSEN